MAEYHELVFEGSLSVVRAFLTGLRLGRGWATPFVCEEDHGIQGDTFGHKVLEKIRLTKDLTYVLVVDQQVSTVTDAARSADKKLGIAVRRDRRVREARFDYQFKVFDRQTANRLRRLLDHPPEEVECVDCEVSEAEHPDGRGIEVYAPEHEYTFRGKGTVRGEVQAVLSFREALCRIEQVRAEKISLVLR